MATILIVDDRPTNRQFLVTLLGYCGHRLLEASDGAEALEITLAERPDLVITDILMPTMDGYEFVQRIRKEPDVAATPVIFYSAAFSVTEAEAMGRNCGVRTVLSKPSEPKAILDAVNVELGLDGSHAAPRPSDSHPPVAVEKPPAQDAAGSRDEYLTDIRAVRELIEGLGPEGALGLKDPDSLRSLVERLGEHMAGLQNVIARLGTLEEFSLRLVKERRPGPMVQLFVETAVKILGARRGAACVLDAREEAVAHLAAEGMDAESLRTIALDRERLPGSLLVSHSPVRLDAKTGSSTLPVELKASGAFLGVPIRSSGQLLGWMCFDGKVAGKDFNSDDERVALSMAAQFAVVYENSLLYQTVQRHAALLQLAVSASERAGMELRESEHRFRQLAENIKEVFFLTNPEGTQMLYVSPAYQGIWGRTCDELYERPQSWTENIHPEDRDRAYGVFGEMAATGRFDFDYRILRPDGGLRWIRARGYPIPNDKGEVSRVAGIAEDITEQKRLASDLSRTNRALQMLTSCNEALIRAEQEDSLLNSICLLAVEVGGYRVARVLFAMDDAEKSIVARAHAGATYEFHSRLRSSWAPDRPTGQAPPGRAIRSGETIILGPLAEEPSLGEFAAEIREARLGGGILLPLTDATRTFGLLTLYCAEGVGVTEDELRLLRELADDLAFGIGTLRARAERERLDRVLVSSLQEKEALLKEVHHRVKNNMQVITSLLRLESNRIDHETTKSVLRDMQNRIQSMAVLHETLYRSGNFARVDLGGYLRQLVNQLARTLVAQQKVEIHLDVVSFGLDLDQAIPCGLIVNELVSNAFKHAFPPGRAGSIWIRLEADPDGASIRLQVKDDGVGLPSDFETRRTRSLGLQLVADLARQLQGTLETLSGPGASFEVRFRPAATDRLTHVC